MPGPLALTFLEGIVVDLALALHPLQPVPLVVLVHRAFPPQGQQRRLHPATVMDTGSANNNDNDTITACNKPLHPVSFVVLDHGVHSSP